MNAHQAMAAKIKLIQDIQARGLRVLIHQRGAVTVWDKQDPSLEWHHPDLATAHREVLKLTRKS